MCVFCNGTEETEHHLNQGHQTHPAPWVEADPQTGPMLEPVCRGGPAQATPVLCAGSGAGLRI